MSYELQPKGDFIRQFVELRRKRDMYTYIPLPQLNHPCQVLTSGNYSRLCADILFARSMGYYIIQV